MFKEIIQPHRQNHYARKNAAKIKQTFSAGDEIQHTYDDGCHKDVDHVADGNEGLQDRAHNQQGQDQPHQD